MNRLLSSIALPSEGLALFRRVLGLLCLLDGLQRLTQASMLYSDRGVLPRFAYYTLVDTAHGWSLYLLSGQPAFAVALLLLTLVLAAAQLLGRTNMASRVALWALLLSVQERQPGLIDSADDLLRLLLLWDIFLPQRPKDDVVSLAGLGLQIQLTLTILVSGLLAGPARWLMAAQWGEAFQAMRAPWLGQASLLALLALWAAPTRRLILPVVGAVLLAQAVLMHPAFPCTVAAGLLCLWRPASRKPDPRAVGALSNPGAHKATLLGWTVVLLVGPLWVAFPGWHRAEPLASLAGSLGFRQNWGRVYPLASPLRGELILRPTGYPKPLLQLDLNSGRRLRLLTQSLLQDVRLATPLTVSQSVLAGLRVPVEVWLKTERLDSRAALPRQEIRQLDSVTVRAGRAVPRVAP